MKKTLANFLLISGFLACSFFPAITLHAENQPVPELQRHVNDLAGLLRPDQQEALENKLTIFEQKKGSQVVVLIIPTTEPETISEYTVRVFDAWKLGRKKVDDGVLITLALNDKDMRIDVGYGLEGAIPDAIAKRIIEDVMLPKFKQGDFYGGLIDGTNQVISRIDGEPLPLPNTAKVAGNDQGYWPLLLIGAVVSGLFLRSMLGTFFGSLVNGGLIGLLVFFFGATLAAAMSLGFMAFFFTLSAGSRFGGYGGGGPGGFGSGGGTFGGGGASGKW
ncbi:MAG TPA: YgcG family protein [Methyloradius sp.]